MLQRIPKIFRRVRISLQCLCSFHLSIHRLLLMLLAGRHYQVAVSRAIKKMESHLVEGEGPSHMDYLRVKIISRMNCIRSSRGMRLWGHLLVHKEGRIVAKTMGRMRSVIHLCSHLLRGKELKSAQTCILEATMPIQGLCRVLETLRGIMTQFKSPITEDRLWQRTGLMKKI